MLCESGGWLASAFLALLICLAALSSVVGINSENMFCNMMSLRSLPSAGCSEGNELLSNMRRLGSFKAETSAVARSCMDSRKNPACATPLQRLRHTMGWRAFLPRCCNLPIVIQTSDQLPDMSASIEPSGSKEHVGKQQCLI